MRTLLALAIGCSLLFGSSASFAVEEINEQEKLYRYFGAACNLHKEGKYEEALEILQYILDKNPDDVYVTEYRQRVKEELEARKENWVKNNKKEAEHLKKKKLKELEQDGITSFKNGDFDNALIKFSDILSLDSGDPTAKQYMEKLKTHYRKEIKIANLAEGSRHIPMEGPMDEIELQYLALNKKAGKLLGQAELGYRVEEIITAGKAEQERSRHLMLGPGDIVQISVLDHPELSGEVVVQVNGEIVLPLVNDQVIAKDLTVDELTERVKERIQRYVQKPRINVSALEYKSKLYYVVDEVGCTPYPITRSDFTLRDALFTADWGDNRALGRVLVMKPSERSPSIKQVDAFKLVYRGNLEDNFKIEDGDVIYIPMTVAAKVTKTIGDILGPFRAIRQARDNYLNLKWNEHEWRGLTRVPADYDRAAEDGKDVNLENISLRDYIVTR